MTSRLAEDNFNKLLLEAIDEALASLGGSVKQAIYFHLKDRFEIRKEEIPERIGDFSEALEKIFGVGADFLEILIMKNLYEQIEQPLYWNKDKDLVFTDYILAAKSRLVRGKRS